MTPLTLCQTDEIAENSCRGFNLTGDSALEATVFAINQQHTFYVYVNHCPHLGLPLEWMPHQFLDRDACYIQCATHGALFRIQDGHCVSGPCLGESLTSLPFKIEGKSIIIDAAFLETVPVEKK